MEKKKPKKIEPVRRVRGMQDFLPERAVGMRRIAGIAEDVARLYGFERIEIPILEQAGLYRRSLGLESDVVMKEMYAFEDKNGEELCLRPEGTAGVMRLLIENGLTQTLPQQWFYEGAMFRRERPQRGRFRQFHQCGIEWLHKLNRDIYETEKEVKVVDCAWHFLKSLDLQDSIELKVNWLGTAEERAQYGESLKKHFQAYAKDEALSPESLQRLERNTLRVLDSKDPRDQEAIEKAPSFFLNDTSQKNFNSVQKSIKKLEIPCYHDSRLVRGLDYYNGFVFEFVEKEATRAQSTVLAGGRYDGLCVQLGGKHPVAAIGWAAGLERLLDLARTEEKNIKVFPIGNDEFVKNMRNKIISSAIKNIVVHKAQSKELPDYVVYKSDLGDFADIKGIKNNIKKEFRLESNTGRKIISLEDQIIKELKNISKKNLPRKKQPFKNP